jgi:predicted CopG family antitoxin
MRKQKHGGFNMKTITIEDEVYEELFKLKTKKGLTNMEAGDYKNSNPSFSDTIKGLLKK